ncbi:MAG TPA: glycosyltransferase family 4 protein [Caulobacteraceae bacterium]|nr:glycosyltransferase family 4 protein [Caulobacteraceae bacterium]
MTSRKTAPMRILWVVNLVAPRGAGLADPHSATFGGWISTMLAELAASPDVEMAVAMRSPGGAWERREIGGVTYYYIPPARGDGLDISAADCSAVLADCKPDLLHAEGSEMAYSCRFLHSWPGPNVVSLQGVLHGYEPYEYGGLHLDDLLFSWRPRLMAMGAALMAAKRLRFAPRLKLEARTLARARNLIGRTEWDRAQAFALNPGAPYFTVHRILRPPFRGEPWKIEGIDRHTLFIGNAASPRKGAHFVLRALAQLKPLYPDIRLRIAGPAPQPSGAGDWKKQIGYAAYLRHLIGTLDLADQVAFTGVLTAEEMAAELRRSHAFVLPSVIENSPNSLAEAMMLGTPAISAYAGGAPDMAEDGAEALFYRPEDPQMLAWRITQVFESDALARKLSAAARKRAMKTHDPADNRDRLLAAYRTILSGAQA